MGDLRCSSSFCVLFAGMIFSWKKGKFFLLVGRCWCLLVWYLVGRKGNFFCWLIGAGDGNDGKRAK